MYEVPREVYEKFLPMKKITKNQYSLKKCETIRF